MSGLSASQQARLRPILPPQVDRYAGLPVVDLCDSDTDVFNFNDPAGGSADELRTGDNARQRGGGEIPANDDNNEQKGRNQRPLQRARRRLPPLPNNNQNPYAPPN